VFSREEVNTPQESEYLAHARTAASCSACCANARPRRTADASRCKRGAVNADVPSTRRSRGRRGGCRSSCCPTASASSRCARTANAWSSIATTNSAAGASFSSALGAKRSLCAPAGGSYHRYPALAPGCRIPMCTAASAIVSPGNV
jgi:hypothetical protein